LAESCPLGLQLIATLSMAQRNVWYRVEENRIIKSR